MQNDHKLDSMLERKTASFAPGELQTVLQGPPEQSKDFAKMFSFFRGKAKHSLEADGEDNSLSVQNYKESNDDLQLRSKVAEPRSTANWGSAAHMLREPAREAPSDVQMDESIGSRQALALGIETSVGHPKRITFNPDDQANFRNLIAPAGQLAVQRQESSQSQVFEEKSREMSLDFHNIINMQQTQNASAVRHPPNEEKSFISAIQRDKDASYVVNPNISYSVTNASFLAPNISQISGINQGAPTPGTDKMATPFFAELQPSNTGQSKITVPEFKLEEVSQEKLPLESAPGIEQPGARHAHRLTLGQELPGDFVPSQEGLQDDQLDLQIRHQYLQEQQLRNQLLHQQILQQQSVLQQQQMLSQHYSSFGSSLMHSA